LGIGYRYLQCISFFAFCPGELEQSIAKFRFWVEVDWNRRGRFIITLQRCSATLKTAIWKDLLFNAASHSMPVLCRPGEALWLIFIYPFFQVSGSVDTPSSLNTKELFFITA
jgi:hypothetical protein